MPLSLFQLTGWRYDVAMIIFNALLGANPRYIIGGPSWMIVRVVEKA